MHAAANLPGGSGRVRCCAKAATGRAMRGWRFGHYSRVARGWAWRVNRALRWGAAGGQALWVVCWIRHTGAGRGEHVRRCRLVHGRLSEVLPREVALAPLFQAGDTNCGIGLCTRAGQRGCRGRPIVCYKLALEIAIDWFVWVAFKY